MKIFPMLRGLRQVALLALIFLPLLAEAGDQELSFYDYTAPTLSGQAQYGTTMASSGDWLAVGAPGRGYDLRSGYVGGRVFLWKRETGNWKLRQVLIWPYGGPTTERWFGHALAMDGGRLLVSTWRDEQVLAYRLQADAWVLDGHLTPQGPSSAGVGFGEAIALQGDVAVIGSPQGTVGHVTRAGWVDVFQRQTTGWVHQARLADPSPSASAALGRRLALDGGFLFAGIYNHDLPSLTAAGKVVVFQNTGGTWGWSRDLLPPSAAKNGQFGFSVKVADGRLFVPSSNPAKVFEFSISDGLTLVSQTAAIGLHAVSGDLLVTGAQYPKAAEIFRRQPDQSWRLEKTLDATTYYPVSAHVKDDGVLIGRSPGGAVGTGKVDLVQKQTDGTWTEGSALSVVSADALRKVAFGRRISASDTWLVVGAPLGYSMDGESGLVFIYRKRSDGWWVFHSLLTDAVSPDLHAGFLGARVALSGDLIAVGTSDDDTYWPTSRVIMYRYHSASDTWKQEAVIQPPPGRPEQKFGLELALEGDLLAATCSISNPSVGLYRRTASGWEFETVLDGYYSAVSLDGGRLLAGSARGNAAYVFEKKATGWSKTAKLQPPSLSGYQEFGSHVAISGTHIMVSGGVKSAAPAVPFELVGNKWQRQTPLTKPASWTSNAASCGLSGSVAVHSNIDQTALYLLNQGKWTEARSTLAPRSRVESVALHGGQLFTGSGSRQAWIQDLVRAPGFEVLSDYSQIYEDGGITTFDAGEQVMGAEDLKFAVFKTLPLGITPVKVAVSISGDTSDFTLSQTQFEIGINQEIQTRLSFMPLTVGTREVRVTFSPDMDGAWPMTFAFRVRVVADKVPLQFALHPASGFVYPAGNMEALECQVTGTRPWTFRWFKDGRPISSADGDSLALGLPNTGRYHVEVTNAAGTIRSRDALVGYGEIKTAEIVTHPGGTARMVVSTTGPGIQIQWRIYQNEEWVPLMDKVGISGSRTPVLTVRNARQSASYGAYLTLPAPQGTAAVDAECNLHVVHPPVVQFEGQQLTRGESFASYVGVQFDGPYLSDPVIRVSGLPPGLTATPEGYVEGMPTTTGIYRVTISVTISGLTGTKVIGLAVNEPMLPPPGIYWGWFEETEGQAQRYAVVANLQPSGAISAVVHLGAARYPLAGMLQEKTGMQSQRRLLPYHLGGKPQNVWLVAEPGQLYLMALAPGADESDNVLISQLRLIKPHAQTNTPASLGKHSMGFLSRSSDGFAGPEGHGFGSLTVSADHRVTYVGQMPDGTSLTGSSWLSTPAMEDDATSRLYFYQADEATRTRLYGAVRLTSDVSEPNEIAPESLEWLKLPGKGRILADGFDPTQISFITSRPQSPASLLMRPGTTHSLGISGPDIFLEPIPFQVSSKRQPLFSTGLMNPVQARFDLYAPTGFLTGQFTLRDPDPLNPQRLITRQVQFRGMLLPEHEIGLGAFLLPALPDPNALPPTTLKTSPIGLGAIEIGVSSATEP